MMKTVGLQSKFLNKARRDKIPVTLFLMNGFQMKGLIVGFDDFSVVLNNDNGTSMIYKHAISTISPSKPINVSYEEDSSTTTVE